MGKDVKNQVTAVNGFDVDSLFDVADLRATEFIVKNQQADVFPFSILLYLFELALSNIGFGIRVLQLLDEGFYGSCASCSGKKFQFFKVFPDLKILLVF